MIDPAGRAHHTVSAEGTVTGGSRSQPPQSESFAVELSDKLAGTTKSPASSTGLPASLPGGEQSVTWRDPGGTSTSGLNGLVITYPETTSGTTSGTTSSTPAGTETPQQSFDQAYWASQPAAVQQLQDIQNPTQRAEAAEQLAEKGYSIDVPIMVWGWDPAATTAARQSMGYTWVPSALQQPVQVSPGLNYAGDTSYNPANPPAGSITV
jgi:hypothetical protein